MTCPTCPYATCIDICPDYNSKRLSKSGIPKGLRRDNPTEYFRQYREINRARLTAYQNEYNKENRVTMLPKWREQKRKERAVVGV